jgi:hypothetical protein
MMASDGVTGCYPDHPATATGQAVDTTGADGARQQRQRAVRHCRRCDRDRAVPEQIAAYGLPTCHRCTRKHARKHNRSRYRRQPCTDCGGPKPRGRGHRYCRACQARRQQPQPRHCKDCGAEVGPRRYTCDACQRELHRYNSRAWANTHRDKVREASRRYARTHPEVVEAAWRRRYAALKADPKAWADYLESARFQYRLKAERDGRPVAPVPEERYPQASPHWRVEDPEPLRELVREWMRDSDQADLARTAGVSDRLIYRLLHESDSRITVAAADRIVTALGLHLDLLEVQA